MRKAFETMVMDFLGVYVVESTLSAIEAVYAATHTHTCTQAHRRLHHKYILNLAFETFCVDVNLRFNYGGINPRLSGDSKQRINFQKN